LKWSSALKDDAKVWAEELLDSCGKGEDLDAASFFFGS
jgi:hypothetical protein